MKVDIICPLYNAQNYIVDLHFSLLKQKNVEINKIRYVLTESSDDTEKKLKENGVDYTKIKTEEFSHSLTREKEAFKSESDILVFITQDVIINDECWLENLINPIICGECVASFSRQISKSKGIEKYTREKNYPKDSYVNSKEDIPQKGLKTFFFSDAASAIKTSVFKELGGYDGKKLPTNEDMYIAYKIIQKGYKIKYCADSVVVHSHNFTLKEMYKRYYLIGVFMGGNSYLDEYGTSKAGGGLAKYVLKRSLKEFNVKALIRFFPDMIARYLGMKRGKSYASKKCNNCK